MGLECLMVPDEFTGHRESGDLSMSTLCETEEILLLQSELSHHFNT